MRDSRMAGTMLKKRRIADVTTHCLRPPYRSEVQFAQMKQASAEYCLVVIRLDDGTEGIAEAVCRPECSGEDARAVAYQVDTFFKQGEPGIGILIDRYQSRLQSEQMVGAIILSSLLGIVVFWFFGFLARRAVGGWHESAGAPDT